MAKADGTVLSKGPGYCTRLLATINPANAVTVASAWIDLGPYSERGIINFIAKDATKLTTTVVPYLQAGAFDSIPAATTAAPQYGPNMTVPGPQGIGLQTIPNWVRVLCDANTTTASTMQAIFTGYGGALNR